MVPWPIALLTLFFGVIATIAAATVWKIVSGASDQPLVWPLVWLALSGGVMLGLPLLKLWGRVVAVVASGLMAVTTLAIAARLISAGHPLASLLATVSAGAHVLAIRYLQRPPIKLLFQ